MTALLYKQLRLVCHPMTPVFCLFGIMVLIPNYPYTIIFFYVMLGLFFTFLNIREQKDIYYSAILPVPKRDTVKAGCVLVTLVELLSLAVLAPCALLAVRLQPGKDNRVGMDPNLALFAAGFLLYAVFNAVFLPSFYANGYKVGIAFLKAVIPTTLVMMVLEALPHFPALTWLDDLDGATQLRLLPVLVVSAVVYGVGMLLTFRKAAELYEKVDL